MNFHYRLLVAIYFSSFAASLLSMQPHVEHNQWKLRVPLAPNSTN